MLVEFWAPKHFVQCQSFFWLLFFFLNEGSNQSTVTCSVLFILKNYSVKSSKWIKWIKKTNNFIHGIKSNRLERVTFDTFVPAIFSSLYFSKIRSEYSAAHEKICYHSFFCKCVYMYSWDRKYEFNTPQEWLYRHQGLMSTRRRNRLGLLIQSTLCTLHKINKRKPSVGKFMPPIARREPACCSAPPPLDVLVAPTAGPAALTWARPASFRWEPQVDGRGRLHSSSLWASTEQPTGNEWLWLVPVKRTSSCGSKQTPTAPLFLCGAFPKRVFPTGNGSPEVLLRTVRRFCEPRRLLRSRAADASNGKRLKSARLNPTSSTRYLTIAKSCILDRKSSATLRTRLSIPPKGMGSNLFTHFLGECS